MVEVRFTGNPTEIRSEMAQLLGSVEAAPAPKPAAKLKDAAPAEIKPGEPKTAEAKPATPGVPTVDDVRGVISKMVDHAKIGKPGVAKFFADHFAPAKKASDLPADAAVYASFIDKAAALLST
jgi:hypothetical protein